MRFWKPRSPAIKRTRAFSLLELMVACAVFAMLLTLLFSVVSQTMKIWQQSEGQKARKESARICLEMIARDLESAVFPLASSNTFQFWLNPSTLAGYQHRDAIFWQAATSHDSPAGVPSEVGYFVQWSGKRAALCRYFVPADKTDSIFRDSTNWLTTAKLETYAPGLTDANAFSGLVAENVIGLWVTLYDRNGLTNGLNPSFDSRSSTNRPAFAEIGIAVIDPRTAARVTSVGAITNAYANSFDDFAAQLPIELRSGVQTFKTRVPLPGGSQPR